MAVATKQSTLFDLWNTYRDNSTEQINRPKKLLQLGIKISTENF